jgi:beta-glucanase (GH16 family)
MSNEQYPLDSGRPISRRSLFKGAGLVSATALLGPNGRALAATSNQILTPDKQEFAATPSWDQNFRRNGPFNTRYYAKKWNIDTGYTIPSYNEEAEILTSRPKNVHVEAGKLVLKAHEESYKGHPYTSARINTQGKFSFQYGKLEVDLKGAAGVGTWGAAWLMPEGIKYHATQLGIPDKDSVDYWPLNGEIDFYENVGYEGNRVYPAFHTYDSEQAPSVNDPYTVPTMTTDFNTYGVEMTPGQIDFTLNGSVKRSVTGNPEDPKSWPFDQPYYLILNLAMGGKWGGTDKHHYPPYGIEGDGPWQMEVAGVRYYDYVGSPQ